MDYIVVNKMVFTTPEWIQNRFDKVLINMK